MAPQRALGNLPKGITGGQAIKASDIAMLKKAGPFGQLPSALASAGFATPDARKATMKAGATRFAGMKRIPLAAGAIQTLQGDPIGGLGTAAGGLLAQGCIKSCSSSCKNRRHDYLEVCLVPELLRLWQV